MRKHSALTIGLLLFASALTAQPASQGPGAGQPAPPRSPEILSDGKVVFRLLAPAAASVTLGGDYPIGSSVAMVKDDSGIDGVRTLDWRNVFVMRDEARYASRLRVPGPEAADYQVNDVPHGTVAQVTEASRCCPASPSTFQLDDGLITTHGAIKRLLQEKGVKHTLVEVPGYGHEWKFWRLSLRDLCSRLFQPAEPVTRRVGRSVSSPRHAFARCRSILAMTRRHRFGAW